MNWPGWPTHRLSLTRLIATYRCEIVQKVFSKDQWSMFFFLVVDPLKSSKSRPWLSIESPVTHFLTIGDHWITIIYWNEPRGWGIRLRWSTLVLASIPSLASFVQSLSHTWKCSSSFKSTYFWIIRYRVYMGMDQYLLIPFLEGWTSIYQLFWCSPGVQGFDPLPYPNLWGFMPHLTSESKAGPISLLAAPPDQPNFRVKNTYKTNVWLRTYKCKYIASYKNVCVYIYV